MKREQIAPRLIVMKTVLLTVAKSVFLKLHVKVKLKYKQITEIHLTSTGTQHYYRKTKKIFHFSTYLIAFYKCSMCKYLFTMKCLFHIIHVMQNP